MDNVPMLSICVPTYGHEKYIAEALNSILSQKTKYTFEVLVGEDASPDRTREILKKYEAEYPNVFTMFYREKNMWDMPVRNTKDLKLRCRGKYIISLEGDDFWTDENKIQSQIDFLETHPDYIAVAHNCEVVGADSKPLCEAYPECKHEEYTIWDYAMGILPGQTATVMYRNFYRDPNVDASILSKRLVPGDRLLDFVLLVHGKIHCIQKKMSAYRHITHGGTSYSANCKYQFNNNERWHYELMDYGKKYNMKIQLCSEMLYLKTVMVGVKKKSIGLRETLPYLKKIRHKGMSFALLIISYCAKRCGYRKR